MTKQYRGEVEWLQLMDQIRSLEERFRVISLQASENINGLKALEEKYRIDKSDTRHIVDIVDMMERIESLEEWHERAIKIEEKNIGKQLEASK